MSEIKQKMYKNIKTVLKMDRNLFERIRIRRKYSNQI